MTPDLATLYPQPPAPRPEHAPALEAELLRRFDARPLPVRRWLHSHPVRRLAFGSVLLVGLAAASQAPVEGSVPVGYRFLVALPPGGELPPRDALARALRGDEVTSAGDHQVQVEMRVLRSEDQQLSIQADVWSEASPAEVESRLRALPELASATFTTTALEGQVHQTLAQLLGQELFDLPSDPATIEAARQKLQAKLSADGRDAQVDLQVDEGAPGKKRVMVKVTRDQTEVVPQPPSSGER
jgi:hypothetical protein